MPLGPVTGRMACRANFRWQRSQAGRHCWWPLLFLHMAGQLWRHAPWLLFTPNTAPIIPRRRGIHRQAFACVHRTLGTRFGGQWRGPGWILCPDMPGLRSAQADYGSAQRSLWKSPTNGRGSADARVRGIHLRLTNGLVTLYHTCPKAVNVGNTWAVTVQYERYLRNRE